MCEITESESMERRLDSLAAENERLKAESADHQALFARCCGELGAEMFRRLRAERERDAALLGLGRVLSGADAARPTDGELVACAREFIGLDAAPAGEEGGGS
jgi:hypothetical protein